MASETIYVHEQIPKPYSTLAGHIICRYGTQLFGRHIKAVKKSPHERTKDSQAISSYCGSTQRILQAVQQTTCRPSQRQPVVFLTLLVTKLGVALVLEQFQYNRLYQNKPFSIS